MEQVSIHKRLVQFHKDRLEQRGRLVTDQTIGKNENKNPVHFFYFYNLFSLFISKKNNKLFFAGEHTHIKYYGTVHGAYASGRLAGGKICESLELH